MKNNYTKFISFCFLFIVLCNYADAQTFAWAKQAGSASILDEGKAVGVDASGNVYTAGSFGDSADFDPGANVSKLYSNGVEDIFIQKLDASGNFVWAISIGSATYDMIHDIYVDAAGNTYVTGQFTGTVDFDPSAGVSNLTTIGSDDIFFAKYNTSGALVFAKNIGGTAGDAGRGIWADGSGNIFLTGYFRGLCDFDPSANIANQTSVGTTDIFVAKYDATGGYAWAVSAGGTNGDIGQSITVDVSGNVIVTGDFYGTSVDFDPGLGTVLLATNGFSDIFVAKYTSSGALAWAKSMGGSVNDDGFGIATDASGNVYTTGYFQSTVDFDPGAGITNLTAVSEDIFMQKLNTSGDLVWVKQIGGVNPDQALDINISNSGNLHITGFFTSVVDFDPGISTANLTGLGGQDIFVATYDSNGAYLWAKSIGGTGIDQGNDIAVATNGDVHITGYFNSTVDFDPGTGITNLVSLGSKDAFTEKLAKSTTSIPIPQLQLLSVYPNPAQDKLYVQSDKQYDIISTTLLDISGKVIKQQTFHNSSTVCISTYDVVPGNYILHIVADNYKASVKLVKN